MTRRTVGMLVAVAIAPLVSGCEDAPGTGLDPLTQLEGVWTAESFELTHQQDPQLRIDLVDIGGSLRLTFGAAGGFSGQLLVPDLITARLDTLQVSGAASVEAGTMSVTFAGPGASRFPDLVEYTLAGGRLTWTSDDAAFDFDPFDPDPVPAPADLRAVLRRHAF